MGKLRHRREGSWAKWSYVLISRVLFPFIPLPADSPTCHMSLLATVAWALQKGSLAHRIKQSESLPFIPCPHSRSPARQSSEPRVLELVVGNARSSDIIRDSALSPQVPFIFKHLLAPCWGMKTMVSTAFSSAPLEARLVFTSKHSAYLPFLPRH